MPSFSMLSFHWRQVSILIEAVIIILVAFVPVGENQLANSLTSLACGIQVESFRRIHNRNIATAMCVGNMRTAVESLCSYYYHREPSVKKTCGALGVIFSNIQFYHLSWWQHLPKSIYYGSKQALFLSTSMLGEIGRTVGKLFHGQSQSQLLHFPVFDYFLLSVSPLVLQLFFSYTRCS